MPLLDEVREPVIGHALVGHVASQLPLARPCFRAMVVGVRGGMYVSGDRGGVAGSEVDHCGACCFEADRQA